MGPVTLGLQTNAELSTCIGADILSPRQREKEEKT